MLKFIQLLICSLLTGGAALAQNASPILKFGLFADAQYADCPPGNMRFYRETLPKLDTCINYFNREKVQFTIQLGDLIDRENSDLDSVKLYLSRLNQKIYHITGNHDYKQVAGDPSIYKQLNMPSQYYSFKKKNWVFIMLNTNDISTYTDIKGTEKEQELADMQEQNRRAGGKQGHSWNGGVGKEQMKWLDHLLAQCEKKGNHALIFTHHPLYPPSEFTALNPTAILQTISAYTCVKAVFSGHHHAGAFGFYKGIPMITHEGMVETEKQNAYSVVEITPDSIRIKGHGRASSHSFKYSPSRQGK